MAQDYWRHSDRKSKKDATLAAGRDVYKPAWGEVKRVAQFVNLVRYPGWKFTVHSEGRSILLGAFRSNPVELTRLQALGPWPIPPGADQDQVFSLVLEAVASVDGEAARGLVRFLPPREVR